MTTTATPATTRGGIDMFPTEILSEIFMDIVMDDFEHFAISLIPKVKRVPAPWNLAAVCGYWRCICLQNPKLWSYIVVGWHSCFSGGLKGFDGASVVRVHLQLERSAAEPLHVDGSHDCGCRCALSMLRAVGRECHRWQSAAFVTVYRDTQKLRDTLHPSSKAPLLRSFVWDINYEHDAGVFICPFTELTSLRSLTLTSLSEPLEGDFPWHQLTHLHIELFMGDFDLVLDILSNCTALTNLTLDLLGEAYNTELEYAVTKHDEDSVVLPNLTFLDIARADIAPSLILPFLRLPQLRKMAYDQADIPSDILSSLIQRSSCPLAELKVLNADGKVNLSLLEQMPELESLQIDDYESVYGKRTQEDDDNQAGDGILRCLTVDSEVANILCPGYAI